MTDQNPSISSRVADGLEQVAARIRELSVDRASNAITWAAISILLLVLVLTAVFWLLVGIFRSLGALIGTEAAYAVVGLIFMIVGAVVWSRRFPKTTSEN